MLKIQDLQSQLQSQLPDINIKWLGTDFSSFRERTVSTTSFNLYFGSNTPAVEFVDRLQSVMKDITTKNPPITMEYQYSVFMALKTVELKIEVVCWNMGVDKGF